MTQYRSKNRFRLPTNHLPGKARTPTGSPALRGVFLIKGAAKLPPSRRSRSPWAASARTRGDRARGCPEGTRASPRARPHPLPVAARPRRAAHREPARRPPQARQAPGRAHLRATARRRTHLRLLPRPRPRRRALPLCGGLGLDRSFGGWMLLGLRTHGRRLDGLGQRLVGLPRRLRLPGRLGGLLGSFRGLLGSFRGLHRGRRLLLCRSLGHGSLARRLARPCRGPKGLVLQLAQLGIARAVLALQLKVLANCLVENAHARTRSRRKD
jgi:hypothetical protein